MIKHSTNSTLVEEQHAERFNTNKRWFFFTLNMATVYNSLSQDRVEAKRLRRLKKILRKNHGTNDQVLNMRISTC